MCSSISRVGVFFLAQSYEYDSFTLVEALFYSKSWRASHLELEIKITQFRG